MSFFKNFQKKLHLCLHYEVIEIMFAIDVIGFFPKK